MQATSSRSSARPLLLSVFFWVGLVLVVGIVLPGYLFWLEGEAGKTATPASFAVALMAGVVWTSFPLPATFFRRYTLVFFVVAGCLAPVTFLAFLYNSLEYNPHAPYSSGLYLLGFCLGYLGVERLCRPMPLKSGHRRGLAVLFLLPGLWLGGTYAGVRYIEGEMAASEAYFMAVSCDPQAPPSAGENLYTVFGDRCYSPWDAETSALHPPLADAVESGDARKNIRLLLSREGSCLKVGEYGPYSDMISAIYYVEAPPFDIRGMAASNRFPGA